RKGLGDEQQDCAADQAVVVRVLVEVFGVEVSTVLVVLPHRPMIDPDADFTVGEARTISLPAIQPALHFGAIQLNAEGVGQTPEVVKAMEGFLEPTVQELLPIGVVTHGRVLSFLTGMKPFAGIIPTEELA